MEKLSKNTIFPAFSFVDFVGFFFFRRILNWVFKCQKFYYRFQFSLQNQVGIFAEPKIFYDNKRLKRTISSDEKVSKAEGDQELSREEIEIVMQRLEILSCSEENERNPSEKLNEFLSFDKISAMFEENEPSLEELKVAFSVFDENKDGFIDPTELQRVLGNLGLAEGSELVECERMIRALAKNGDSRIDFKEFVKLMEISFS